MYRSTVKVKNKIVRAFFLYIFKCPALNLSIAAVDFFREDRRKRSYLSYSVIGCELRASFDYLLYIIRAHSNKAGTLHKRRSIHSTDIHRSSAACLSCYPEIAQSFDSVHSYSRFLCAYEKFESAVLTSEINRILFAFLTLFKTQNNSAVLVFGYADLIHINTSL